MLSTAASAIVLAIASPIQIVVMAFMAVGTGIWRHRISQSEWRYLHLEIDERIRRLHRCERLYGPDHTETLKARLILPDMIRTAYNEKLIDQDDLQMYLDLGYVKKESLNLLTRPFQPVTL